MSNVDAIKPQCVNSGENVFTLTNWTHRMGVPPVIEKPESTFVGVIYRDATEGHLLARNVAWSQVHQFRIESQGEELGGELIPLVQPRDKNYLDGAQIEIGGIKVPLKEIQLGLHSGVILPDQSTIAEQFPHYFRDVSRLDVIDIYRVLDLWQVNDNAIGHAIKKLLVAGGRGAKNAEQDVREAMKSLQRWQEMQAENGTEV